MIRESLEGKAISDCHEQSNLIDDPLGTDEQSIVKTEEIELNGNEDFNYFSGDSVKLLQKSEILSLEENNFPCHLCEKSFSTKRKLYLHINRHKRKDLSGEISLPEIFECETCQEKYSTSHALYSHKKREKHYRCITCSKSFNTSTSLRNHKNYSAVHSERKHICETCGKSYLDAGALKVHKNAIHEGIKDFICPTCGKSHSYSSHLRKHIRSVHEGLKNHVCESCGKSFTTGYLLKTQQNGS